MARSGPGGCLPELLCQRDLVQLVPSSPRTGSISIYEAGAVLVTEQAKNFPEAWPRGKKRSSVQVGEGGEQAVHVLLGGLEAGDEAHHGMALRRRGHQSS